MNPLPRLALAEFTPAEVETITRLTPAAQRDWRHRGFLPSVEGHARFDVLDITTLYSMKALADRGIGPQRSSEIRVFLGQSLAWHVLGQDDAYEGCLQQPVPTWARSLELAECNEGVPGRYLVAPQIDWPRRRIFGRLRDAGRILPGEFLPQHLLIWWAIGDPVFEASYDKARAKFELDDPRLHEPAIVFDLFAAGYEIVRRAGRPFVIEDAEQQ